MTARHAPTTAPVHDANRAGSVILKLRPRFNFKNLFAPQKITLQPDESGVPMSPSLPQSFVLTPTFKNGNITLEISNVHFNPDNPPPVLPIWSILDAMMNSDNGVSIVIADASGDVLLLSGSSNPPAEPVAGGIWFSTLSPNAGIWSSAIDGSGNLPSEFHWTFLLDPDPGNTEDVIQTVIFGFRKQECNGEDCYRMISAIPSGWSAGNLDLGDDGVSLAVADTDDRQYCLSSGSFSGGLGRLVCGGIWKRMPPGTSYADQVQPTVTDGGTWTGTSGGPIPPPPGSGS